MKKIGIIGSGRIGGPVISSLEQGEAGDYELVAVLNRSGQASTHIKPLTRASEFFASKMDLIIETAGPEALQNFGERALSQADTWTVSAAALADTELYQRLENAGLSHGHRLRVLSGAMAGLDGVSTLAVDTEASVEGFVDIMPSEEGRKTLFSGTTREAAQQYPETVNVAAATALAGPGLDNMNTTVIQPATDEQRSMGFTARSCYGEVEVKASPAVIPPRQIHMVAANIIACLRRECAVIWAG